MYSVENKVCLKHFTIYNTSAALDAFHQAFFISFLNVGHIVAAPWAVDMLKMIHRLAKAVTTSQFPMIAFRFEKVTPCHWQ